MNGKKEAWSGRRDSNPRPPGICRSARCRGPAPSKGAAATAGRSHHN